jgi:hypothetical protein
MLSPVMLSPVMLSPVMLSPCAYALEIPVVSKNSVVDSAIEAPRIVNAVNTANMATFILDDMFDTLETQTYISIV